MDRLSRLAQGLEKKDDPKPIPSETSEKSKKAGRKVKFQTSKIR